MRQAIRLIFLLGWQDLKHAYRRTALGPFWITAGMAIQTASMGFVFSTIFGIELKEYLPFLSLNLVIWSFLISSVNETATSLIQAESFMRQVNLPNYIHSLKAVWKNLLIGSHNLIILPIVFLIFWTDGIQPMALVSLLGLAVVVLILCTYGYLLSVACLRFRDLAPVVSASMNVMYFVTPIMWKPELLGDDLLAHLLLGLNPLYHIFQVVRMPILGEMPTPLNWAGVTAMALVGIVASRLVFTRLSRKVTYWF